MATIPNRIKAFADATGISIRQIEIKTGASNGTFGKAITQNRDIGSNWIEKIVSAYPQINAFWLVTGQGDMIASAINDLAPTVKAIAEANKSGVNVQPNVQLTVQPLENANLNANLNVEPNVKLIPVQDPKMGMVREEDIPIYGSKSRAIPILDARAAAGWPYTIDGSGFLDQRPTLSLPFGWFQSGEYVLIQIEGDSMHPTIYNGDWAFVRKIEKISEIKDGYVHVVLTREGIVCKRVLNRSAKGHLALQSDNSAYPTYTVPLDEILSIWKVEMKMSAILRNENLDIIKRLSGVEADIAELKLKKK